MPQLLANGVRHHVIELGEGPTVVMLHGLLVGNLATWYLTAAPALARQHRVLLYDLRGHGLSERPAAGYDLPTLATDLEALLDLLAPGQAVDLVGHSYGALVALHLARRAPGRVRRLALVEAPLSPADSRDLVGFLSLPAEAMAQALPGPLQEDLARGGRRAHRLLSALRALAGDTTLLADIAAQPELSDAELAALEPPLLAVYGRSSSCRPHADRLARVLPGARVALCDGGHYLPLDAPEALTDLLAGFLHG